MAGIYESEHRITHGFKDHHGNHHSILCVSCYNMATGSLWMKLIDNDVVQVRDENYHGKYRDELMESVMNYQETLVEAQAFRSMQYGGALTPWSP